MPFDAKQWIETHKQEAAAGGGAVLIVAFALLRKRKVSNSAAANITDPTAATVGGIGIPGTTEADVQNAVQDQINGEVVGLRQEMADEIARIPAGPTGKTGATGARGPAGLPARTTAAPKPTKAAAAKPPTMYAVNTNRINHKDAPISEATYRAQYAGGTVQNAAQTRYINARAAQLPKAAPAKAATPKPRPVTHTAAPAAPKAALKPAAAAPKPAPTAAGTPKRYAVGAVSANKYGMSTAALDQINGHQ